MTVTCRTQSEPIKLGSGLRVNIDRLGIPSQQQLPVAILRLRLQILAIAAYIHQLTVNSVTEEELKVLSKHSTFGRNGPGPLVPR